MRRGLSIWAVMALWAVLTLCVSAVAPHVINNGPSVQKGDMTVYGNLQVFGAVSATGSMSSDTVNAVSQLVARDCVLGYTFAVFKDSLRTAGKFSLGVKAFANLGTPINGTMYYCPDCTAGSNPATGGGTGAIAIRQNGAWKCL